MRWKQFLTPVENLTVEEARKLINETREEEFILLDVRQPAEYDNGHIAGARLAPMPELSEHLRSLDKSRKTIVYCASGGRSRVAAQLMAGKGFSEVYNVKGGFNAWEGRKAFGPEEAGLELFSGDESPEQSLVIAYAMEDGLREFYLKMSREVKNEEAAELFSKLADIEIKHKDRIFEQYTELTGEGDREAFEATKVRDAMEGGIDSDEYVERFNPNWESPVDVVEMAMAIEGQAMDLYTRAAEKASDDGAREALLSIASDEKSHLQRLGELMDQIA